MGKVVSIISSKNAFDILLDFENATPNSPAETSVYNEVSAILDKGPGILEGFVNYQGCGDLIKNAISKPTPSNEDAAWEGVSAVVEVLKTYFFFSQELQTGFASLISALTKVNPLQSLSDQQALAKLLADTIDFVLRFDELKMKKPQLQNDFSYFRRMVNQKSKTSTGQKSNLDEETNNRMSLFFASATPMLQAVADTCRGMCSQASSETSQKIFDLFSTMSNVCLSMVSSPKITSKDTKLFCLRGMTGSVIVYDHINPLGAFSKKSPIRIKHCINTLKTFDPPTSSKARTSTTALINAMKYSTLTLKNSTTPNSVKQLLA